jgi:hypothetical protein
MPIPRTKTREGRCSMSGFGSRFAACLRAEGKLAGYYLSFGTRRPLRWFGFAARALCGLEGIWVG